MVRYIKSCADLLIRYLSSPGDDKVNALGLEGYCNSNYTGCKNTLRSITGWIFFMAGGPILWSSYRQRTVTKSSIEAEYYAASAAASEAVWIRSFLLEIGEELEGLVCVWVDNTGAIALIKGESNSNRIKHVRVPDHFARETVERGEVSFQYVRSEENIADILTKPLGRSAFERLRTAMGLKGARCYGSE